MKTPKIKCAVCNRLVDEVLITQAMDAAETRISVKCHGTTESMMLSLRDFFIANKSDFEEGVAFKHRGLPESTKLICEVKDGE